MRKYTGPTLGGGEATVNCPAWCVTDHDYWGDRADDMFHESAAVEVFAPRDRSGRAGYSLYGAEMPLLSAQLVLHSTDPLPSAALVRVMRDEREDHGTELDLSGVDGLLAQVDAFRERLAGVRGTLAAIDSERRRSAA